MHCGHVSLFKFSTPNKMINATIVFILILNKHLQYKTKDCAEKLNAQAYASASYTKHGDEGFCC